MKKLLKVGSTERFHTSELHADEIEELTEKYDLHHIVVEDMEEPATQDKIDVYDDCLFLVLHFPRFDKDQKMHHMNEFNCILGKNYLVTITKMRSSIIEKIKEEYAEELQEDKDEGEESIYKVSPYYILYRIIDGMYDKTLYSLKNFSSDLRRIESAIFNHKEDSASQLEELLRKRRGIVTLRHSIHPQSEIITELQKETEKLYGGVLDVYFEDLLYKIDKITAQIQSIQEELDSLYDTANTMTNIRINRTMKIFTIFTAIIGVMTLISGLYGMNVSLPGEKHPQMFYNIILIMGTIIIALLLFFRRKGWLK